MRRTTPLEVSEEDRALLLSWLGSTGLNARIRLRARIVVASAGGQGARALARDLGVSLETIYLWRRRYTERGIEGLRSQSLPGRRSQIDRRQTGTILRAGRARGTGGTAPSVAAVARATRVSRATVRRLWDRYGLAGAAAHARGTPAREAGLSPCNIVGIFIDPPLRVLARVAPTDRPHDGHLSKERRPVEHNGGPTAASALLTALEAFDSDAWIRRPHSDAGAARFEELLARLTRMGGGAALELLEGPVPRNPRGGVKAGARDSRYTGIRLVRERTRGGWLARAYAWLAVASRAQDTALAGALGYLMDYFASRRAGSEPFIWTPEPLPRLPLKTA